MCMHCDMAVLAGAFDLVIVSPDGSVFPAFVEGVAGADLGAVGNWSVPPMGDNSAVTIEATGPSEEDVIDAYRTLVEGVEPISDEPEAAFMSEAQAAEYVASQPPGTVFIDASFSEWTDISSEAWRTYIYPDHSEYTVVGPQLITFKDSGSHRIFDDQGQSHWIRGGFMAITWRAKPGKPNFVK